MTHATRTAVPSIKFCGLTRGEDITSAGTLGATFVGGILAGGPRLLSREAWRARFGVRRGANMPARAAVLGALTLQDMVHLAADLAPDVMQLHGDPDPAFVAALREALVGVARNVEPTVGAARAGEATAGEASAGAPTLGQRVGAHSRAIEIWPVLRVAGARLPPEADTLAEHADALVLDAKVVGAMGGTGVALDWESLAADVSVWRGRHPAVRLVLAGGLTPENVATAVDLLAPDVVDVSSGVETAPGIKDPARMRAFVNAVHLREQRG